MENAGSALATHLEVMLGSLGVDETPETVPRIDAADWTAFARRRVFISNLPHWVTPAQRAARRPAPWTRGWAPMFRAHGHQDDGKGRPRGL